MMSDPFEAHSSDGATIAEMGGPGLAAPHSRGLTQALLLCPHSPPLLPLGAPSIDDAARIMKLERLVLELQQKTAAVEKVFLPCALYRISRSFHVGADKNHRLWTARMCISASKIATDV